jgi:integrase-like protein
LACGKRRIDANQPDVCYWVITRGTWLVAGRVATDREQVASDAAVALGDLVGAIWVSSCDRLVFMDQPSESISSHDPPWRCQAGWFAGPAWRCLPQGPVRAAAEAIRPTYRALVFVGAYGGLRIGELAGLRRGRVDLLRGTVSVAEVITEVSGRLHVGPPKTRASRRKVGLPRFVMRELEDHLAGNTAPDDHVFTAPEGGTLRIVAFRNRIWRPATDAAGLAGLRIHDLRHTAVALWIAAGASPKEVAARAGHTSVSFTLDRYGHLYPESDASLRDRLDTFFTEGQAVEEGVVMALAARTPPHEPTG